MANERWFCGEYLAYVVESSNADLTPFGTPVARAQLMATGATGYDPDGATPVTMTVASHAASGDIPAGWTMSLASATTLTMTPGRYVAQIAIPASGEYIYSDHVIFTLEKGVARDA